MGFLGEKGGIIFFEGEEEQPPFRVLGMRCLLLGKDENITKYQLYIICRLCPT